MALKFKPGWNTELKKYADKYGEYQAFLDSFDEAGIAKALFDAKNRFNHPWCQSLIDVSMDPFSRRVFTIEQGAHQTENMRAGGFCLHFTGRDDKGSAFHFYVKQKDNGLPEIFEMSFKDGHMFRSVYRT
ncbi:hypothetical protein ACYFX5_15090 [Bremerella sp. T1]|uniref:hypothetical protein n=1 Tax=Bremerella sp. TYQ1 TaxID=3119568 RepID=UPI001CCB286F|nr:hypothetical protein [Bremerella volcania]UBM34381.1 hypothetical protein LA756_17040 [Bremerella volcania]